MSVWVPFGIVFMVTNRENCAVDAYFELSLKGKIVDIKNLAILCKM